MTSTERTSTQAKSIEQIEFEPDDLLTIKKQKFLLRIKHGNKMIIDV